jgi:hypothetical protein
VRPARFSDVRTFCQVDSWSRKADSPGRSVRKHEVWTKALADGSTLHAVVSKGRGEYSARMMAWIVKHELRVTEEQFWAAVRHGVAPEREATPARPRGELLPLALMKALLAAGYTIDDVRDLTHEEARRLLERKEP